MTADAVQPALGAPVYERRTKEYLRLLLLLLLTASFFDGYDGGILDIIKPQIQDTYGLTEAALAWVTFGVKLGAVFAFFVALSADWVGRRPILLWSVIGYTIFTGLTAFAPNVYFFTCFQFAAQIFLGAEYAVAVTMISEEFPPTQRGRALGKFTLVTAAGVILVPLVALSPLTSTALEWRVRATPGVHLRESRGDVEGDVRRAVRRGHGLGKRRPVLGRVPHGHRGQDGFTLRPLLIRWCAPVL